MPVVLRSGPYRLYFYSHEPNEPPHIHIDQDDSTAKFWLHDCALASSTGFSPRELGVLQRVVTEHRTRLSEAWHEFFGG